MAAATTDPQMKSQNAMLSIIFLEQSSIYETEHALALDYLKKVANNKFTRRRKYYLVYILRPVQQPIYSMPYLPLFVEKYLFD